MPTHSPELESEIKTVQSRLTKFIESTRPAHDANLRDQDPTIASHPEMFPNFELPKEKKPASRRPSVRQNAKRFLRAAPKFLRGRLAPARHSRKCQICRHPDRELIEDLYVHWHSGNSILDFINSASDDDDDPDQNENNITWVAIYRHAYALGLDEIRRRNLRFAFELLIEQAGDITPTSASILAAARAYAACVNTDGQWNDPPKRVIVTNIITHNEPVGAPSGVHSGSLAGAPSAKDGSANERASVPSPSLSTEPARAITSHVSCVPASDETVGAGSSPSFLECGLSRAQSRGSSTPLCHTTGQLRDADSPSTSTPSGVHSSSLAGAPFEKRGESPASDSTPTPDADAEIRNPAKPRKRKEKTFSNR